MSQNINSSNNSNDEIVTNSISKKYILAIFFLSIIFLANFTIIFQNFGKLSDNSVQNLNPGNLSKLDADLNYVTKFDLYQHTVSYVGIHSIVNIHFSNNYTVVEPIIDSIYFNPHNIRINKYTHFDNTSMILEQQMYNYSTESVNSPQIYFLNFYTNNNSYTIGKELQIGCSIPKQYLNQFADTCVNVEIKLLSQNTLAVIQEYGNKLNVKSYPSEQDLKPYGSSVLLFDIQNSTIINRFNLPDNGTFIYNYISNPDFNNLNSIPKDLWIYYKCQINNTEGYINLNLTNGMIQSRIPYLDQIYRIDTNQVYYYGSQSYKIYAFDYGIPIMLSKAKMLSFYATDEYNTLQSYFLIYTIANGLNNNILIDIGFYSLINLAILISFFLQRKQLMIMIKKGKNYSLLLIHRKEVIDNE